MTFTQEQSIALTLSSGGGAERELTAVSLFAGIEGFGLALERNGVKVAAAVEIDEDCRGVIARHFPQTRLFGDVREVTGDQLRAAGFVPERGILTGGFPCQDLSIAGRRLGLGGARSGLYWEIVRLARELRPQWLILENVPGLLSAVCPCPGEGTCATNGRAVRCGEWRVEWADDGPDLGDACPVCGHDWDVHDAGGFCATCSDTCEGLPEVKQRKVWADGVPHSIKGGACPGGCMAAHGGAMGTVLGALGQLGYGFAYRVLDSQFFGVPQRRERVFIVGCLGDRAASVQVLLEPEGGTGNPAPGREAGTDAAGTTGGSPGVPRITGTLTTGMLGDYDDNTARQGFMVTAPTLTAGWGTNHGAPGHGGKDDAALAVTAATLQGGGRRGHRVDAEGAAGGHLIPVALRGRSEGSRIEFGEDGDPAFTVRTPGGGSSYPMVAHALTARERKGADSDATSGIILTHTLTSEGHDASEDGTGRGTPLVPVPRPLAATLTSGRSSGEGVNPPGRRQEDDTNLVPMAFNPQSGGSKARIGYQETPTALQCSQVTAVQESAAVRRLTPLECERLQAFPDDWTRWKLVNGQPVEQSDSARYREIGNAVTVTVPQWIVARIVALQAAHERAA